MQDKWVEWDKKNLPPPEHVVPKGLLPATPASAAGASKSPSSSGPQPSVKTVEAVLQAVE
ncbi:MAG: hypothetical protein ACLP9L_31655 [Thermoguttaceae bacterium]